MVQKNATPSARPNMRESVIRYTFTPEIVPRVRRLFGTGFPNLAYMIVVVFNTLAILPPGHPYLHPQNRGRFSVLQALGAVAAHLRFDRKHADHVFIFGVILSGIVMLFLQIILWFMALFTAKALAYDGPGLGPRSMGDFFNNPAPDRDLAFRVLDLIFGVPGIFNSDQMRTTAFHNGLHALFQFYSYGILLVGVFVIIYYTMTIVFETSKTGAPFGGRFNMAWAPVRLILFFGLLLPTGNGLNLAQYIVLNAAKYGSNMASNAWLTFDRSAKAPYLAKKEQLIAQPNTPDLDSLASFMALARVCSWAEGQHRYNNIKPYFVFGPKDSDAIDIENATPAFPDMVKKANGGFMTFKFGVKDKQAYPNESGNVFPYCGELTLNITDQGQPGAAYIQQAYVEMIGCMWSGRSGAAFECKNYSFDDMGRDYTSRYSVTMPPNPFPNMDSYVGQTQKTQNMVLFHQSFEETIQKAVQEQVQKTDWATNPNLPYGWGGAGIWFNKVAEMNGAVTSAVFNKLEIKSLPYVMEHVKREKLENDKNTPLEDLYNPRLSNGQIIDFLDPRDEVIAGILVQTYTYWGSEQAIAFFKNIAETHNRGTTGNVIIDTINTMMGTKGLFDMCKNTDIHPLAQLSSLGRGLIEHSIRGYAMAAGVGLTGGIANILNQQAIGAVLSGATKFFITFATIGLVLGFILFYVLPFMPFIYFFFAVMTWAKGIFEAMVAMPLWALAHLKIDGEGMPGDSASNGYFQILEIFLRPVGIIIGFLGGILIFTALVKVLNSIFYLVISNLSGHLVTEGSTGCFLPPAPAGAATPTGGPQESVFKRGVIDEFFYTVVYTVIVFMMAQPCFKLVDLIPDYIQRWLGSSAQPFGATDGDQAEGMIKYISAGAGLLGSKLQGGFSKGFSFLK